MRVGRRWDEEYEVAVLCEVLESTVPFIYSEDSDTTTSTTSLDP